MATSPAVITSARQMGKSVLSAVFDEWVQEKDRPKEYLEFNTSPLALVIAMQEAGKTTDEIFVTLKGVGTNSRISTDNVVTKEHEEKSKEIYSYFSKKHTLRRIKGDFISEWMNKVDELCENPNRVDKTYTGVLVTLPRIYQYNRDVEAVMKNYKTVSKNQRVEDFESELTFVKALDVHTRYNGTQTEYYWSTPSGHLVRFCLDHAGLGKPAWDLLAKQKTIKLSTINCATSRIKGYDFYVLHPNKKMEVNIA